MESMKANQSSKNLLIAENVKDPHTSLHDTRPSCAIWYSHLHVGISNVSRSEYFQEGLKIFQV
jgi:hypothetical protein